MSTQPGKKKVRTLLRPYLRAVERKINARITRSSPLAVAGGLVAIGLVLAVSIAGFLYLKGSNITGVGSLSSPSVLEASNRALGGRTPLETLDDYRRNRAFLDSVDRFGLEGMEEIYSQKFKLQNHE